MAKLVYDEDGRLLFTKEMKEEYTLLIPQMLPIHFAMLVELFRAEGFKAEMLTSSHRGIVNEGLKYVHNDTCYPALLVIGQLLDAVKSGSYDTHKIALLITQTGGGCRASNYIHLLRKALVKAGYDYIPVISVNISGLEKNPGFSLTVFFLRKAVFALLYGDMIMNVSNQVRPYEVAAGATDAAIAACMGWLLREMGEGKGLSRKTLSANFNRIIAGFAAIPVSGKPKVRVGVVGEIYIKYSPLGNNNLEAFLLAEGAEPVVPGLLDFMIFKFSNRDVDVDLYGGKRIKQTVVRIGIGYMASCQRSFIEALKRSHRFRAPSAFEEMHQMVRGYLGDGNKMGEGWLLTGEMLELIHSGTTNIVCAQPFGCLPNHVVGKGMIRKLKDDYPSSNIVAIDYDPGATQINQENRIKLMLANARGLSQQTTAREPAPSL